MLSDNAIALLRISLPEKTRKKWDRSWRDHPPTDPDERTDYELGLVGTLLTEMQMRSYVVEPLDHQLTLRISTGDAALWRACAEQLQLDVRAWARAALRREAYRLQTMQLDQ